MQLHPLYLSDWLTIIFFYSFWFMFCRCRGYKMDCCYKQCSNMLLTYRLMEGTSNTWKFHHNCTPLYTNMLAGNMFADLGDEMCWLGIKWGKRMLEALLIVYQNWRDHRLSGELWFWWGFNLLIYFTCQSSGLSCSILYFFLCSFKSFILILPLMNWLSMPELFQ